MKVNVNYSVVHEAIDSLKANNNLKENEVEAVLQVLIAIQGVYIPTKDELERQEMRLKSLDNMDYDESTKTTYDRLMEQCGLFENKYF